MSSDIDGQGPSLVRGSIGFLGMGLMGAPMAANLVAKGYSVTVWNRTKGRCQAAVDQGGTEADTAAEAVDGCDAVVTMLHDGESVRHALFGLGVAEAMQHGSTLIDMTSTQPSDAVSNAAKLADYGVEFLDAPVSGGVSGATDRTMTIFVGGQLRTFERHRSLLESMGNATHVGSVGGGQMTKLANQIVVAAAIEGVAEALLFASAAGLDLRVVTQALAGGFADSRVLQEHGDRMIQRNFDAGGKVEHHLESLKSALGIARDLGVDLPVTADVKNMFERLVDRGLGGADHSALLLELETVSILQEL